jgi:hypothetical protein
LIRSSAAKKPTREIGCSFRLITINQWSHIYTPSVYAQPERFKSASKQENIYGVLWRPKAQKENLKNSF